MKEKNSTLSVKENLENILQSRLGGNMVGVELSHEDYRTAIDRALRIYRQRAANSTEEAMCFMTLKKGEQVYILPKEITLVQKVYRQGLVKGWGLSGVPSSQASMVDPLALSFSNVYLLRGFGNQNGGIAGNLLTMELYSDFLKVSGRMSGTEMPFIWDERSHKITFSEMFRADEDIVLHVWKEVDDDALIESKYSGPWIEDYSLATCKELLGIARRRYSNYNGAGGSFSLDGENLINEAKEEKEKLIQDIGNYTEGSIPPMIVIG